MTEAQCFDERPASYLDSGNFDFSLAQHPLVLIAN
jgi:hypothetical protein